MVAHILQTFAERNCSALETVDWLNRAFGSRTADSVLALFDWQQRTRLKRVNNCQHICVPSEGQHTVYRKYWVSFQHGLKTCYFETHVDTICFAIINNMLCWNGAAPYWSNSQIICYSVN